jgi:2-methylisocitrate lyase-like PEP mutase family enzyme
MTMLERFRSLHAGPELLVLPNCWDAGSARVIENLGARALATTSAGLAWANGYPDGNFLPVATLVAAVRSIARVLSVPLTVDIEGGYSDDPDKVGETAVAVLEAGAVGINIEDGGGSPELLATKIASIKRATAKAGGDLFINARTDVYLRGLAPAPQRAAETLARAERYRTAGADGLFVPGIVTAEDLRTVVASAGLPLNVMAWTGLPGASQLADLGVRRLSAGSAIAQAAWGHVARGATALLRDGRSEPQEGAMPYGELQALFPRG